MGIRLLITFLVSYLLGNLNGAVLVSRFLAHDDVRQHGSGNAGFTNFFRNYGGLGSVLVLLIDGLKAAVSCTLGARLLGPAGYALEGSVLAGLAVSLGHDFPILLGFHGGKGIACGFMIYIMVDWRVALIFFAVFAIIYLCTKLVSLSSILSCAAAAISFAFLNPGRPWAIVGCAVISVLAIFMHRQNIIRLLHGKETKTDFFKRVK